MCLHVFGGTSSPVYCNHALQRAALDNVSSYRKEATNTILRNFYVDGMLKSVPSAREALILIQEVTDLCKSDWFKPIKFISNKKHVLFQFPDALRRDGAKDKDLTGSFPIERVLGIFWDAENDVIKFKIDLKDQPMTSFLSLVQYMILLGWHPHFSCEEKDLFKVCIKSWMFKMKWILKTPVKNGKHGKSLKSLRKICIRKCIKPEGFGIIKEASLNHFSSTSELKGN